MLFARLWFLFAGGGIAWGGSISADLSPVSSSRGLLRPPRRRYWPRDVDEDIPGFTLPGIV